MSDEELIRRLLAAPAQPRRGGCLATIGNVAFLVVIIGLFLMVAVKVVPDLLVSYGVVSPETMVRVLRLATPAPTFTADGTPLVPPTAAPPPIAPAPIAQPAPVAQPAAPAGVAPVAAPEVAPTPWPIDTAATEQVLSQQTAAMQATADAQTRIDAWLHGPPSTPTPTTLDDWKASFADQPDCSRALVGWVGAKRTECAATATAAAGGGE